MELFDNMCAAEKGDRGDKEINNEDQAIRYIYIYICRWEVVNYN